MTEGKPMWRLSLREFLGLVAFAAVACAALRYASPLWSVLLFGGTWLLATSLVIVGFVECGRRRAAAIGAVVGLTCYALLWNKDPSSVETFGLPTGTVTLNYDGYLPTTVALNQAWTHLRANYYVEAETGEVIAPFENYFLVGKEDYYNRYPSPLGWNGGSVTARTLPPKGPFMAIGHCLFALFFAYLGAKFAVWVYHRRKARDDATTDTGNA